jgi:hypothetical protein
MVNICRILSAGIPVAFGAFILYAASIGVTRQTLYAGPVGYWLGIYLAFALVVTFACVVAIAWLASRRQTTWLVAARNLALAWGATLLAYAIWNATTQPI